MTDLPDLQDLSLRTLDAQSLHVDWRENLHEWHHWEAVRAEESDKRDVWIWPGDRDENEYLFEIAAGPMMNYAYELEVLTPYSERGRTPAEAAELLVDLPLCLVEAEFLSEDWYLALTGGGMDFSWEICEAYMRLGFIPPTEFADLPNMAGRPRDENDRKIIEACKRAYNEAAGRSKRGAENLENKFAVPA